MQSTHRLEPPGPHRPTVGGRRVPFLLLILLLACGGTPAPREQPIAFRHDIHAGENDIPCLYCHAWARQSTAAGVPSVQKCVACHVFYAGDDPGIARLREHWEAGKGIAWARIHSLPDYVYFSHKRHVRGGVECRECHGPVEEMAVVTQWAPLSMAWCLDCHRKRGAGTDCLVCHQ